MGYNAKTMPEWDKIVNGRQFVYKRTKSRALSANKRLNGGA
ncbi:MAG: hypothetical protein OXU76_00765 [Alphaproteobacteria bacterium]|nr:hypothetical protein [Alphaproteobacteria bacterium]